MHAANTERSYVAEYTGIITVEPGKRGGKPCIRGMRITVDDVLEYLSSGMTDDEVLSGFPYLTREDIQACRAFDADRKRRVVSLSWDVMRILLDQNLSPNLRTSLQDIYPESLHVQDIGLSVADDLDV